MKKEEIIDSIKAQYPRETRKQLVKVVLMHEKGTDMTALKETYTLIDRIFAYVLKECNWSMPASSEEWDNTPLEIMGESFPKLSESKWYKDQLLVAKNAIDVEMKENG
ncbi:hypothetical protein [Sulfurovum riftiae]|uniref:Uncharacterized protein n=1 Tax=Sulfurovum riftiae TaxID=1630136 RepID=A0A151CJL0_9BACT|nr:hypothetical protein [Sulfurovum riftiae]KYJ87720.1 hypothetical protein AS592_11560 [Sulfurovum riftiae]